MSKAKTDALLYYKGELKLTVEVKESGMLNELVLQRPLGFLSQYELKSVEAKTDDMERMDKIINFLLGKEDKCFGNFCDILTNCNYKGLADKLRIKAGLTAGAPGSPQRAAAVGDANDAILSQKVYDHSEYLVLMRRYASRPAGLKGRTLLAELGLDAPTIETCYMNNTLSVEEAVNNGLIKWSGGQYKQPVTWNVLLKAMKDAGMEEQYTDGLKTALVSQ